MQGVYRRREFFSSANCCFIGQNKLLHLEISLSLAETLSPVLSSEQIRWRGVSTPRHLLLLKPKQRNVEPTLSSTTTQTDCIFAGGSSSREPREGWRRIPGRIWVLSLAHKNQNAVTTLLLRKTEKLRLSGTRRCYKRAPSGGRGGRGTPIILLSFQKMRMAHNVPFLTL